MINLVLWLVCGLALAGFVVHVVRVCTRRH